MTRVRAAVAADANAIGLVGRVAFIRQYEGLVDPANYTWAARQWYSDQAVLDSIEQGAKDPAACFLVAERDRQIVGFLQYDEAGPEPELHRIYVASDVQGSGIGRELMNALHARLRPTATYVLVVVEGNEPLSAYTHDTGFARRAGQCPSLLPRDGRHRLPGGGKGLPLHPHALQASSMSPKRMTAAFA